MLCGLRRGGSTPSHKLEDLEMKTIKWLILGLAASLFAASEAQAADLSVKAKAVEYVRICSLYGAGFFYIPGTIHASSWVVICAPT
jgi:hypothetical protein